ncbi:hypothetical protein COCOBI_02-3130 [Coccomyxa sp. Obi]|nr:hypothetical protein COCOBI_02-3130 [Coccomyxa sp. Obi]
MRMGMGSIGQAVGLRVAIATGVATNLMNGCGRRAAEEQLRDLGEEPTVFMMEDCLWSVNNFVYEEDRSKAIGEERDGFRTRNVPKGNVNGGKFSTENGVKRAVMVGEMEHPSAILGGVKKGSCDGGTLLTTICVDEGVALEAKGPRYGVEGQGSERWQRGER